MDCALYTVKQGKLEPFIIPQTRLYSTTMGPSNSVLYDTSHNTATFFIRYTIQILWTFTFYVVVMIWKQWRLTSLCLVCIVNSYRSATGNLTATDKLCWNDIWELQYGHPYTHHEPDQKGLNNGKFCMSKPCMKIISVVHNQGWQATLNTRRFSAKVSSSSLTEYTQNTKWRQLSMISWNQIYRLEYLVHNRW